MGGLVGIGAMLGERCIGIGGIPVGVCIDTIPGGLGDELFCWKVGEELG